MKSTHWLPTLWYPIWTTTGFHSSTWNVEHISTFLCYKLKPAFISSIMSQTTSCDFINVCSTVELICTMKPNPSVHLPNLLFSVFPHLQKYQLYSKQGENFGISFSIHPSTKPSADPNSSTFQHLQHVNTPRCSEHYYLSKNRPPNWNTAMGF